MRLHKETMEEKGTEGRGREGNSVQNSILGSDYWQRQGKKRKIG